MLKFFKKLGIWVMGRKTLSSEQTILPPSAVKGMTVLDRNAFEKKVNFPALVVPVNAIKDCKKLLRSKLPPIHLKENVITQNEGKTCKLIFLDPKAKLEDNEFAKLKTLGVDSTIVYKEIDIGYEHFKPRDIFRAIMSFDNKNEEIPKGYGQLGHIVQLNLREHQLPYKSIIGQVLLDKIPTARTVVNKLDQITSEYRNLDMELLAGEENYITRVTEHHRHYEFDFSKVFWNPRLSTEHQRIASSISSADTVFDLCAGVGPFSIPLAKKGCLVFANDLNPDCHHWMEHNVKINKAKTMKCYCMDGREFVRKVFKNYLWEHDGSPPPNVHVIINLPGTAVEFLDAFSGLFSRPVGLPDITVYFYIFASSNFEEEIQSRAAQHLGITLPSDADIREVRDVSPNKNQYCVRFLLPHQLLYGRGEETADESEPMAKKARTFS